LPQPRTRTTNRTKVIDENLRKKWRRKEGLALLEGLARDGYSDEEIAKKMKISIGQYQRLRNSDEKIRKALDHGKMTTDYLVEKALLKSALGFSRKSVKVTSIIRYGKLVETQTEELTEDVPPNVTAAQTWLYNRCPDKWKRDPQKGFLDDFDEDTSIHIEVTRAGSNADDDDEDWQNDVNRSVSIRKATKEEREEAERRKAERKRLESSEQIDDEPSLDEWPDNWDELIGDD
jgi:hypothetical protein